MDDLLALKKAQQQTWTRVGYLGNIFTIDHSFVISFIHEMAEGLTTPK